MHTFAAGDRLLEHLFTTSGDNHRVPERMKACRQFTADAGPSARDENRVPAGFIVLLNSDKKFANVNGSLSAG